MFGYRAYVPIPKDENPSLMARADHVSYWDMVMKSLVTLSDPMPKIVIKSRDIVFLEDQT